MICPSCNGRKLVWVTTEIVPGIRTMFESPCDTCFGSGIDLADACAWGETRATKAGPAPWESPIDRIPGSDGSITFSETTIQQGGSSERNQRPNHRRGARRA